MKNKRQFIVDKSFIKLAFVSLGLSLITLFILQHFGEIKGHDLLAYPKSYIFHNPINNKGFTLYWHDGYPAKLGKGDYLGSVMNRSSHIPYNKRLKEFYLPSLFSNVHHIFLGALSYGLIILFFKKFRITIK